MKVGEMKIIDDETKRVQEMGEVMRLDIKTQLLNTLSQINNGLQNATVRGEERAILLNAKVNVLTSLQKYE